jgi:hypothetical protein
VNGLYAGYKQSTIGQNWMYLGREQVPITGKNLR